MSNNILDKFKSFMGLDEFEEEEIDETEEEQEEFSGPRPVSKTSKIVNIHTNTNMKLSIQEPKKYDELPKIISDLKNRKTVVINLEYLDAEVKRQVFEFLNGAIFSLDGNIQKISKDIFVLAPNNVIIDGNMKDEFKNKSLLPWQK